MRVEKRQSEWLIHLTEEEAMQLADADLEETDLTDLETEICSEVAQAIEDKE